MSMSPISFSVHQSLWTAFRVRSDRVFLARAPFLDALLAQELPAMASELQGIRLSTRTARHISGRCKRAGTVSINLQVRTTTAEALRALVREHGVVRNALMNRLLLLTLSPDALLESLDLPLSPSGLGAPQGHASMPTSPMKALEAVRYDTFYDLRQLVQHRYGCGLYQLQLSDRLDWAALWLPEERVPHTAAHRRQQHEAQEMSALLASLT